MRQKFKYLLFFFVFLFILFVLGAANVEKKNTSTIIQSIKSILPANFKELLKRTVFSIPTLNRKTDRHEKIIDELSMKVEELSEKVALIDGPELLASEPNNIKSKANIYNIKIFKMPFIFRYAYHKRMKAVAYLEQTNSEIVLASGVGEFFSFEKKNIGSDNLYLKRIKSNIKNLIRNEKFYSSRKNNFIGIRDLLLLDNKFFFSFVKEQTNGCYNTSIMIAEFNLNYLNFSEFFSYEECLPYENMQQYPYGLGHLSLAHSGGRMVSFKNEKILLTIGDLGYKLLAQDKNSIFGKIISIDLQSKDYEIISMGSRNPQGLYYDENRNIIIHTDHGPIGGDEININFNLDNKIIENYGWPISSYGETSGKFYEEAPLHKSHKDHGFVEPVKYYTPSIAISEIVRMPVTFNEKFTNDFFIGALGFKSQIDEGDRSIHHIRFNESFDQIIFNDVIPIGERIRDMIYIKENNTVMMVLESIPAIGLLKIAN
jgi:hypothetical protein